MFTENEFPVSFNSALPTECAKYIHGHFEQRQKYLAVESELIQLTSQLRLIQKRLITKFKVKNPTPLSNLELLLHDTNTEIMKVADELKAEQVALKKSQNELSCALHVLINLIKLMDCGSNMTGLIDGAFSPVIYDIDNQNWEDVMDAGLCFLIRTVLAKGEKDKLRAAHTSFEEVKDVGKLERHFVQVLERIPKFEAKIDEEAEEVFEGNFTEEVPFGSKIAEASSRLLSARKGLLRRRQKLQ